MYIFQVNKCTFINGDSAILYSKSFNLEQSAIYHISKLHEELHQKYGVYCVNTDFCKDCFPCYMCTACETPYLYDYGINIESEEYQNIPDDEYAKKIHSIIMNQSPESAKYFLFECKYPILCSSKCKCYVSTPKWQKNCIINENENSDGDIDENIWLEIQHVIIN